MIVVLEAAQVTGGNSKEVVPSSKVRLESTRTLTDTANETDSNDTGAHHVQQAIPSTASGLQLV